ncbi:MAG: SpoIID/LytB domain-containing protein [Coriobacteriia bacterium]
MSSLSRIRLPRARRAFAALLVATTLAMLLAPVTALATESATFSITGRGWGHGIGLSQYGAKGYASRGFGYAWILNHYYQGTTIGTGTAPTVMVHLDDMAAARQTWRVGAGNDVTTVTVYDYDASATRIDLSGRYNYWITASGTDVRVHADRYTNGAWVPGAILKVFHGSVVVRAGASRSASLVQILGPSGPFHEWNVIWRGTIRFLPTTDTSGRPATKAVNYVGLDQYLYGVVPRESPSSWPTEALKAQAVAARSYAYGSAAAGSTLYCTTQSQVYNGFSGASVDRHEKPRTNSAVDATRGQLVKYGSTVVRTFFSSASGGHTANVEDVWVTSASQPYYRGVDDYDIDSPDHASWGSAIVYTPATLAGRIRSYDFGNNGRYDYSAPSPATIVSVSTERAASGYVPYMTIRWSTGVAFRIRGTTFQSALRLKSSKFWVRATTPAPTYVRYEQSNARIAYGGAWRTASATSLSGGTCTWSAVAGSRAVITFHGTGFRWVGNRSPRYGRARIFLDGAPAALVDLYSTRPQFRQALWSRSGLSDATHTVEIVVTGTKSAASAGYAVALDAVDITGGSLLQASAPPTLRRFEESDSRARYTGAWTTATNPAMSGGGYTYTQAPTASVTFAFTGTRARIVAPRNRNYGVALVSLDGGAAVLVDLYAARLELLRTVWDSGELGNRAHTLRISPARTRNPASGGYIITLDAIDANGR